MVLLKKIRKTDLFGKIGGDNLSYSKRPSWGMARHGSAETRERAACRGLRSNTHNRGRFPKKIPSQKTRYGDSKGNRTPVTTVKGWCLNRLTMEPYSIAYSIVLSNVWMNFFVLSARSAFAACGERRRGVIIYA